MLNCKQATELASTAQETDLNLRQRIALKFHLFICNRCSRYSKQLSFLKKTSAALEQHIEDHGPCLEDTSKRRIEEKLQQAQQNKKV